MTGRVGVALVVATLGCEASLGSGGGTELDAAIAVDARRSETVNDAAVDARVCTGGQAAALGPDGSCFVHFTTATSYVNAKAGCAAISGYLAYLKTAQLDTFAESFVGAVDTWIGGNDRVTENTFVWEDGTAFIFTAWNTGEPNNANNTYQEDCVIIAGTRATKLWDDRPCDGTEVATSGSFAYLCQY